MSILHVAPDNDAFEHVIDHEKPCGCQPQVIDEGKDAQGFVCKTIIHTVMPPVNGDRPQITKVWLDVKDGSLLKSETMAQQRHAYSARPRTRGVPSP